MGYTLNHCSNKENNRVHKENCWGYRKNRLGLEPEVVEIQGPNHGATQLLLLDVLGLVPDHCRVIKWDPLGSLGVGRSQQYSNIDNPLSGLYKATLIKYSTSVQTILDKYSTSVQTILDKYSTSVQTILDKFHQNKRHFDTWLRIRLLILMDPDPKIIYK